MGKGRAPCCDKDKVKRGPWSPAEDLRLITFIQKHGHENWRALPKLAGLLRCGKSCRLRWINYLRPDVKRGNFTKEEEDTIIRLHESLGNKWSKIASHLDGRTDNEIKNVWNTHLKKRLASKNVNVNPQKNASKESSMTSSSSSSSITSIVSSSCVKKRNLENIEQDQNQWDEGPTTKMPRAEEFALVQSDKTQDLKTNQNSPSSTSSNNSNITCSNPENRTGQGFKSLGHNDARNNTSEEVNKPDNSETVTLFDIPFDTDSEFWDMLESFQVDAISLPEVEGSNFTDENNKWLQDLENELAMEISNDKNMNNMSKKDAEPLITEMYDLLLKPDVDLGNTILQSGSNTSH